MSYPTDYQATLVAAGSIATQALTLPNQIIDSCYFDYDADLSQFGKTVNIVIPTVDVSNASDIANGGISGIDPADSTVAVTVSKKFSSNRKIKDFDAVLANPVKLAELYVRPVIEEVTQKLNQSLAGLISSSNFTTNSVTGSGDDVFSRADIAKGWAKLRTLGVPVDDGNLSLLVSPTVYGNMMGTSEFANESVQGINAAEVVNRRARLLTQFNAVIKDDPHMPTLSSGANSVGILMHKYAIAVRTALSPSPQGTSMLQSVVYYKPDLPVHLQLFFDPLTQAHYIHAFIQCGYAVARENHGCLLTTA